MAKRNPKWRFNISLRYWGLLLLEEENVYLNMPDLGIVNEPFWIDKFSFDPAGSDGVVTVQLRHALESSFDWTAAEEGDAPTIPSTVLFDGGTIPAPTITSVVVKERNGLPWIRAVATVNTSFILCGEFKRDDESDWVEAPLDPSTGVMKTPLLDDNTNYSIRFGHKLSRLEGAEVVYTTQTGIDTSVNAAAPDAPTVNSASDDTSTVTIEFVADLNANYWRTSLYVGSTFAGATLDSRTTSRASPITITAAHSYNTNYYLVSENYDGEESADVEAYSTGDPPGT